MSLVAIAYPLKGSAQAFPRPYASDCLKWYTHAKPNQTAHRQRVFLARVYDMIFRGCYHICRQQEFFKIRTTYEEPIEITFAGQACPRA